MIASSHVLVFLLDDDAFYLFLESTQGYMALERFFVSARTIKRHHHQHRDRQGSCGTPCDSVALSSWGMAALNAASTQAYVWWTAGVQNVGAGRPWAWRYSSHTSVSLACVLRIVASPWSAQIRGAVSVHQGSLIRKARLYVRRACMYVVCCVGSLSQVGVHSAGHP